MLKLPVFGTRFKANASILYLKNRKNNTNSNRIRAKSGLTQEQVANNIKANKDLSIHIGRNETGNQNMSVSTLYELCEYYKVPLSEFLKRVEEIDKGLKIK